MRDPDAFVFNMITKYSPNNQIKAIFTQSDGFNFGMSVLKLRGSTLNAENSGECTTGKYSGYDIEGDKSPLTDLKGKFTCAKLEGYKVVYI